MFVNFFIINVLKPIFITIPYRRYCRSMKLVEYSFHLYFDVSKCYVQFLFSKNRLIVLNRVYSM